VPDGVVLAGFADLDGDVYNAAGVVAGGRVQAVYHKRFLPNYGVFDEARYFAPGDGQIVLEVDGLRLGIVICEDIWYPSPISGDLAAARLDLVCCLSASPYFLGKGAGRERMLRTRARDAATTLAFCNLVGGQDELVFDGRSVLIGPDGAVHARAREFEADLIVAEIDPDAASRRRLAEPLVRNVHGHAVPEPVVVTARPVADGREPAPGRIEPSLADEPQLWRALRLGIADYVGKNGFPGVVVGLSGGIDSALTATLAADGWPNGPHTIERVIYCTATLIPTPIDPTFRSVRRCSSMHYAVPDRSIGSSTGSFWRRSRPVRSRFAERERRRSRYWLRPPLPCS
jgi:NAD+ synthase (glutamine-hydrolysing)